LFIERWIENVFLTEGKGFPIPKRIDHAVYWKITMLALRQRKRKGWGVF